ncbi:sodium/proton antiporter, NhaA family [Tistlia consotensis]|uniref:Na(+)/H(+) antiporter NhaA n=1 Tax=Tistlia consotensis USBA 355 TaxID=560819 RepID=A0A1Y6BGU6_9PROT|nr:Na+/H+ antiporter NhaA [Tistlia consotensis]SMF03229.1 sodium/proton antiporter, NhaA family [Tistlia consotensis USBA 355]SNR53548.1 sodium/proton antiporter, NhaA family [Tistlia consotensis]
MTKGQIPERLRARLQRPVDPERDHLRGGTAPAGVTTIVLYGDYLCPYCRRLRIVLARLREALGGRLAYVYRHFPNEAAHPGATFLARAAEAAGRQGRFWEMHDWIYEQELPLAEPQAQVQDAARAFGLDLDRFRQDLESEEAGRRVGSDLSEGRRNGVTGTPTLFLDGERYDGAWDFHSMLEALQLPMASRLGRSARAFANLPASGGLVLLLAAAAALLFANTALAPFYRAFIGLDVGIGPPGKLLSLNLAEWFSEGLLAVFFTLIGLEIRREVTSGELSSLRAAILPVVGALGGMLAPALIYLSLNADGLPEGWAVPTATDIAFTIGILALLGPRVPASLRVFVAALAVVDDVLSVLTLAVFYPQDFEPSWLLPAAAAVGLLFLLNRARVYAAWPYLLTAALLWVCLHASGVHAALAGIALAAFLPTRPAPAVAPLLAQAATALSTLEHAEKQARGTSAGPVSIAGEPLWEWASRNLSAASDRLLSPADRVERAIAPWSTYVILPLFAFSASGVRLDLDMAAPDAGQVLAGMVLGLVVGKPVGIALASLAAVKTRLAVAPVGVAPGSFVGAAMLCGVGYTVALLLADQAFPDEGYAAVAKSGVLAGSVLAAALGTLVLMTRPAAARTNASDQVVLDGKDPAIAENNR